MKKIKFLLVFFFIIILFAMVIDPVENINSFFKGVQVWATVVLPALFPFFLFTKLLCELDIIDSICKYFNPITKKLFNCDGIAGYIYFSSIISGYPVGAKLVSEYYKKGLISYGQAHRISTFTSTSGPLFIIGTVGIGLFLSQKIGLIMLLSHYISALINGLIYRNFKLNDNQTPIPQKDKNIKINKNILQESMVNSITSILIIGGYISIFFMLVNLINKYMLFSPIIWIISSLFKGVNKESISAFLNGIVEVTKGCFDLSILNLSPNILAIIGAILISFGGLSIHMQAYTFLKDANIRYSFFLLQKITHAIIAGLIACVLSLIMI